MKPTTAFTALLLLATANASATTAPASSTAPATNNATTATTDPTTPVPTTKKSSFSMPSMPSFKSVSDLFTSKFSSKNDSKPENASTSTATATKTATITASTDTAAVEPEKKSVKQQLAEFGNYLAKKSPGKAVKLGFRFKQPETMWARFISSDSADCKITEAELVTRLFSNNFDVFRKRDNNDYLYCKSALSRFGSMSPLVILEKIAELRDQDVKSGQLVDLHKGDSADVSKLEAAHGAFWIKKGLERLAIRLARTKGIYDPNVASKQYAECLRYINGTASSFKCASEKGTCTIIDVERLGTDFLNAPQSDVCFKLPTMRTQFANFIKAMEKRMNEENKPGFELKEGRLSIKTQEGFSSAISKTITLSWPLTSYMPVANALADVMESPHKKAYKNLELILSKIAKILPNQFRLSPYPNNDVPNLLDMDRAESEKEAAKNGFYAEQELAVADSSTTTQEKANQ